MLKKLSGLFKSKPKTQPMRGRINPDDKRGGPHRAASAKISATIKVNRVYSKKLNRWLSLEEYQKLTGANNG